MNFLTATLLFASFCCVFALRSNQDEEALPVVLWHGMGDTCCNPVSLGSLIKVIQKEVPSIYVKSLEIGDNQEEDFMNSYFMRVDKQIEMACKMIREDKKLTKGFNLIGFSQGGQFARAVVQRCSLPVKNLITLGAQHQGVYGFPRCPGEDDKVCNVVRKMLNFGAYSNFVQRRLVQAQYWHDPIHEDTYVKKSLFLAEINNEREPINQLYKQNLVKLTNFVMVMFTKDTMVDPRESELFGFFQPGQGQNISHLEETELYKEDRLGLKVLNENGKLVKMSVEGDHLQFETEWFIKEIIDKYLK